MHNEENRLKLLARLVERIKQDFAEDRVTIKLYRKSRLYIKSLGVNPAAVVKQAVENLDQASFYRGPTVHHRDPNQDVVEFLLKVEGIDMYLKFEVSNGGVTVISYHPQEKDPTDSWTSLNDPK